MPGPGNARINNGYLLNTDLAVTIFGDSRVQMVTSTRVPAAILPFVPFTLFLSALLFALPALTSVKRCKEFALLSICVCIPVL